jgi:hypothetical protein
MRKRLEPGVILAQECLRTLPELAGDFRRGLGAGESGGLARPNFHAVQILLLVRL